MIITTVLLLYVLKKQTTPQFEVETEPEKHFSRVKSQLSSLAQSQFVGDWMTLRNVESSPPTLFYDCQINTHSTHYTPNLRARHPLN